MSADTPDHFRLSHSSTAQVAGTSRPRTVRLFPEATSKTTGRHTFRSLRTFVVGVLLVCVAHQTLALSQEPGGEQPTRSGAAATAEPGSDGAAGENTPNSATPAWCDVVEWTHSWDLGDIVSYDDDSQAWLIPAAKRVDRVLDRGKNDRPLRRDAGTWGEIFKLKPIPDPLVIASSRRFNGRPAMLTDKLGPGGFGHVYALLSTAADPRDDKQWFHAPKGYDTPYWGAVLCRPANDAVDVFGAWDAYNGHLGTTMTMAKGLLRHEGKDVWGMTTSLGKGDPWPSTKIAGSADQTVLVIGKVDGPRSFMEINWRDAAGKLQTDRTNFTLANYTAKEIFFGGVHSSYVSAAGFKTGVPAEAEIDAVRDWSSPWLVPTGPLPVEP